MTQRFLQVLWRIEVVLKQKLHGPLSSFTALSHSSKNDWKQAGIKGNSRFWAHAAHAGRDSAALPVVTVSGATSLLEAAPVSSPKEPGHFRQAYVLPQSTGFRRRVNFRGNTDLMVYRRMKRAPHSNKAGPRLPLAGGFSFHFALRPI
jgi:hypothetical protein